VSNRLAVLPLWAVRNYYVYIMASNSHRIYVGVTNDLPRRVLKHKQGAVTFAARYRMTRLVYVETTPYTLSAIAREKELKGWRRSRKIERIERLNPTWKDLAEDWHLSMSSPSTADPSLRSG
jgi:putative endonuclease